MSISVKEINKMPAGDRLHHLQYHLLTADPRAALYFAQASGNHLEKSGFP